MLIPEDFILKGAEPIHVYLDGIEINSSCIINGNLITIQDIPAAARNFMTAQRVIKANLDNVEEDDQLNTLKSLERGLSRFNSSRSSACVIHDIHEIGYMSGIGGGGISSKLEDIMGFIEPLTSCLNLNVYLPIGILRQLGANRAIIKRQAWLAYEQIAHVKQYFADEMFRQIIEPHVNYTGEVRLVHDLPFEMRESQIEDAIKLFGSGVIPREYAHVMIGFDEDEFKEEYGLTELTYMEDVQIELMEEGVKASGKVGGVTQPKAGVGTDTRAENEKGEENNDSVSGSQSEVKG